MRKPPLLILSIPLFLTAATTAPSRSILVGVYSKDQAARGKTAYSTLCARCHGDNLMGNDDAPQLVDKPFIEKWNGKTLAALVDLTQKKMPSDGPGKLSRKQCTDITAYVLSANDIPAGQSELPADLDVLSQIQIQVKK